MGPNQIVDPKRRYLPSLEGVRGYGFLLVFCGHYFSSEDLARPGSVKLKLLTALSSLGLFAVPAFFVLSGYLIGGILYHTRDRRGYFRVFYSRRIVRVFPVYYLTLLAIAAFYWMRHLPINFRLWAHLLYIQNLLPGYTKSLTGPVTMIHFWSLAVEEQFYLLWPLVVWRFRDRRQLIGISTVLIVMCSAFRLAAPAPFLSSAFTLTRVDAILMGVLLSLMSESLIYRQLMPFAKWATLCGVMTMALLAYFNGTAWSNTHVGKEIWIPLANVTALAMIMAVLEEKSFLNKICSLKWICWLGSLSYSLYIFHFTFRHFFLDDLTTQLSANMRWSFAVLAAGALAFCVTLLLSLLSYHLIEGPLMRLKRHLRYGAVNEPHMFPAEIVEPALAKTGT